MNATVTATVATGHRRAGEPRPTRLTPEQRALAAGRAELIDVVARSFAPPGSELHDDLQSFCAVALLHAAQDFDPGRLPDGVSSWKAFAFTYLRWQCCEQLKFRTRRRRLPCARPGVRPRRAEPEAPSRAAEDGDEVARLRRLTPPAEWELLWEHYALGVKQREIAARLGVTPSAVQARLTRAWRNLRRRLAAPEGAADD